ncbi:MAG: RluA family pseudouridine synthase [Deltaproteobacteria bacterium]|nr:RluA family pseudouridine synthase [Deltaproteobacteria bacterium]
MVSPQEQGIRLDIFLKNYNSHLTRSHLKKLIDREKVKLNEINPKAGARLKAGDRIELQISPPEPMIALPEPIPLNILFEDEAIIVINKPPGLVVHPAAGNYSGTLVNGLLYHYQSLPNQGCPLRPGIVHRLDKNTSGVMVVAKNNHAHQHLAAQFKDHTITRKYLALTVGVISESRGTISSLIGRHPRERKKMSSRPLRGKKAITHWEVLKRYRFFTLLKIGLETGRTHQIRVHLASIHRPVLGDAEYGGRKPLASLPKTESCQYLSLVKRQILHATTLGFIHPLQGEYAEFNAPPPEDFQSILQKLEEQG